MKNPSSKGVGIFLFRDPVGIRTQDPQLRRLLLYPAELPGHRFAGAKIRNIFKYVGDLGEKNALPHYYSSVLGT